MRYNSIGMKLKLVFMLIMSVLLAIFGALDYWRTQQELRHALDGEVAAVGKRLAANLADRCGTSTIPRAGGWWRRK